MQSNLQVQLASLRYMNENSFFIQQESETCTLKISLKLEMEISVYVYVQKMLAGNAGNGNNWITSTRCF